MRKLLLGGLLVLWFSLTLTSCEEANSLLQTPALTEQEIIDGLRSTLQVSTDTSVKLTSRLDGYFKDSLIKIVFPPDAIKMEQKLRQFGFGGTADNIILTMNRSAEVAAKKATPIFVNAITTMTINDGLNIVKGSDSAASNYLRTKTYQQLYTSFKPVIDKALDSSVVLGISAKATWSGAVSTYNTLNIFSTDTVSTDLTHYVCTQGLNGLFKKLKEQEKDIRKDPLQQVTDAIKKIFGK